MNLLISVEMFHSANLSLILKRKMDVKVRHASKKIFSQTIFTLHSYTNERIE